MPLDPDGAAEIAGRSRGTPRIANRLLRRVRDYAEVRADGVVTQAEIARTALAVYDVDELGLDRLDRARAGRPGADASAAARSASARSPSRSARRWRRCEEVAEPFLVRAGLLARTPRGRVATPAAWSHLGLPVPSAALAGPTLFDA